MSPQERKIEAALIDWFKREGFEIDHDHFVEISGWLVDGCTVGDLEIGLTALAQYIADEIAK